LVVKICVYKTALFGYEKLKVINLQTEHKCVLSA